MSDEIRAKAFVVVDDEGNERARIGASEHGVGLELSTPGADSTISLQITDGGDAQLRLEKKKLAAVLKVGEHRVSLKLSDEFKSGTSCGMSVDDAGAWVVAEASPHVGARLLSKNDGEVTFVWLSETLMREGEKYVRTRYVRTNPEDDEVSGWRTSC